MPPGNEQHFLEQMPILYIIATPIGNLEDISLRALRILKEVDLILCEDTRVTSKLLNHYHIQKPLLSYHQHSKLDKLGYILGLLKNNKDLALVSDAGTPGISDPGNKLIDSIVNHSNLAVRIVPIPGPSAVSAAVSISGFPMDRFVFMGFPPTKRKRKAFFREVAYSSYPVVFYESPHRVIKALNELNIEFNSFLRESQDRKPLSLQVVVCRELTKKFETIYRGEIGDIIGKITNSLIMGKLKGEFVIVVKKCNN